MLKSIIAIAALAAAGSANATVLFSQNFDTVPTGMQVAAIPGFTISGGVDVVNASDFKIHCAGIIGTCVDLAGTPGPGTITTTAINFVAGQTVTVSFAVSGNQRRDANDTFSLVAAFTPANGGPADVLSGTAAFTGIAWVNALNGSPFVETIAGTRGFVTYSAYFTPINAGSFTLAFGGIGGGDSRIGPILDDVLVTQTSGVIPEPATWAMLIAGFGLVGTAMRRRRTAVAA